MNNEISNEDLFRILKESLTIEKISSISSIPAKSSTIDLSDIKFVKHQCFLALLERGAIKETDIFHIRTKTFVNDQTDVFVCDMAYRGKDIIKYSPNKEWKIFYSF